MGKCFESEAEKYFYSECLKSAHGVINVYPWVIPQVPLSCLTGGTVDPASKQRVDFVICHPKIGKFVVEIDGVQHDGSES